MSLDLTNVTIDCAAPRKVAEFWSAALGRPLDPDGSDYFVSIGRSEPGRTGMFFIAVPEGKPDEQRTARGARTLRSAASSTRPDCIDAIGVVC